MSDKIRIPLGIEVSQAQGKKAMDVKVEYYLAKGWYFKNGFRSYGYTCAETPGRIIALMYKDFTEAELVSFSLD